MAQSAARAHFERFRNTPKGSPTSVLSCPASNPMRLSFPSMSSAPSPDKAKPGRILAAPGEEPQVPQWQKSKGCLIVTAALELSGNQVSHFYSNKKNTTEMIRMMDLLLDRYRDRRKVYLSWDAASWHISKRLFERIEENNKAAVASGGPIVDTAPLPARAQFLNVIESIFSGMARAIIHNSNYRSERKPRARSIATLMNGIAISVNTRAAPARKSGARSVCRLSSLRGIAAKTRDSGKRLGSNVPSSEGPAHSRATAVPPQADLGSVSASRPIEASKAAVSATSAKRRFATFNRSRRTPAIRTSLAEPLSIGTRMWYHDTAQVPVKCRQHFRTICEVSASRLRASGAITADATSVVWAARRAPAVRLQRPRSVCRQSARS